MKRFVFRFVTFATLFVLILSAGSLAVANGPVNPFVGPDGAQRVYLPAIGKNTSFLTPIVSETTWILEESHIQTDARERIETCHRTSNNRRGLSAGLGQFSANHHT